MIGNNPDNIIYLKLKLRIPATSPHRIWPIMCSGVIPLTSSGFPTRKAPGRITPNKENAKAMEPYTMEFFKIKSSPDIN